MKLLISGAMVTRCTYHHERVHFIRMEVPIRGDADSQDFCVQTVFTPNESKLILINQYSWSPLLGTTVVFHNKH